MVFPFSIKFEDEKDLSLFCLWQKLVFTWFHIHLLIDVASWAFMSFSRSLNCCQYLGPYHNWVNVVFYISSLCYFILPKVLFEKIILNLWTLSIISIFTLDIELLLLIVPHSHKLLCSEKLFLLISQKESIIVNPINHD